MNTTTSATTCPSGATHMWGTPDRTGRGTTALLVYRCLACREVKLSPAAPLLGGEVH